MCHSNRNASVGLIEAARHAGSIAAPSATSASKQLASAMVGPSTARTPKSSASTSRLRAPPPDVAAETDNLRAALEWAYETGGYESGLRIMSGAPIGHFGERTRMLKLLLPFVGQAPIDVQGTVLYSAGGLAFMIADWRWGVDLMRAAATSTPPRAMR